MGSSNMNYSKGLFTGLAVEVGDQFKLLLTLSMGMVYFLHQEVQDLLEVVEEELEESSWLIT